MRKKLKELLHKEEGFTLVELLAVIVILGIIVAIAIPSIGNVIGNSADQAEKAEIELVEDAARLYDIEQTQGRGEMEYSITVGTLVDGGYLDLRSSTDGDDITTGGVKISRGSTGGTTYEYDAGISSDSNLPD